MSSAPASRPARSAISVSSILGRRRGFDPRKARQEEFYAKAKQYKSYQRMLKKEGIVRPEPTKQDADAEPADASPSAPATSSSRPSSKNSRSSQPPNASVRHPRAGPPSAPVAPPAPRVDHAASSRRRLASFVRHSQKTRKGQPLMAPRLESLVQKLEEQNKKLKMQTTTATAEKTTTKTEKTTGVKK